MAKTAMETTSPNLPNHSNVSKENARQEPPKKHKGLAVFLFLALAAAAATEAAVRAARLPTLSLTGAFGAASLELNDWLSRPDAAFRGGLDGAVPLLDAGRTGAQIESAEVRLRAANELPSDRAEGFCRSRAVSRTGNGSENDPCGSAKAKESACGPSGRVGRSGTGRPDDGARRPGVGRSGTRRRSGGCGR